MGHRLSIVILLVWLAVAPAGIAAQSSSARSAVPPIDADLTRLLQQTEQLAKDINLDLGRLRVDKWKTDAASKRQSEDNIDSVQRNLTAALPEFVAAVRSAPRNLAPNFRLYRNLNALYDVLNSLAEAAGAFGPKEQFQSLARKVDELAGLRTALGKRIEAMAEAQAAELAQLRQAQAKAGTGRTVVDDNAPAKSSKRKRSTPAPKSSGEQ